MRKLAELGKKVRIWLVERRNKSPWWCQGRWWVRVERKDLACQDKEPASLGGGGTRSVSVGEGQG